MRLPLPRIKRPPKMLPISPAALRQLFLFLAFLGIFAGTLSPYFQVPDASAQVNEQPPSPNQEQNCSGTEVSFTGVTVKLIQEGIQRNPDLCYVPQYIVIHATDGGNLDSNWNHFNTGSEGNYVNAHFITGMVSGQARIYQTTKMYTDKIEYAAHAGSYRNAIGIENAWPTQNIDPNTFNQLEYDALMNLVLQLMAQYSIPMSPHDCHWKSTGGRAEPGVYGHGQLAPSIRTDPGEDFLCKFLADLATKSPVNGGTPAIPGTSAGRVVPYDAYARPYSWPMTGRVRAEYGFTEEARNLGSRYPSLYPIGDPGVIFSTTNHVEPPPNPAVDKYISPNIDIEPDNNSASARAVYSTHAGWITYADWAGEAKGYTIQVESDVDGDGQSDMATRYMRLQAPQDGYFAPDIGVYQPPAPGQSTSGGSTAGCPDGQGEDWAGVNKWDSQLVTTIAFIKTITDVEVDCAWAKAMIKLESGGVEAAPNAWGYMGVMQVGPESNCDLARFDIHTTEGNFNCGIQEMANWYKYCDNHWDQMPVAYFSGHCVPNGASDGFGTSDYDYKEIVTKNHDELVAGGGSATPTPTPAPSTDPAAPNPQTPSGQAGLTAVLEAEEMQTVTGDIRAQNEGEKPAGRSMAYYTAGAVTTGQKTFATKGAELVAKQVGNCTGQPKILMAVDSKPAVTFNVNKSTWSHFRQAIDLTQGNHKVKLTALGIPINGGSCSIWVDSVMFSGDGQTFTDSSSLEQRPAPYYLEAEMMDISNATTAKVVDDNTASASKMVRMTGRATLSWTSDYNVEQIVVKAKAKQGCGWPTMRILVDDEEVYRDEVKTTTWSDVAAKVDRTDGKYTVKVEYLPGLSGGACGRQLMVDALVLSSPPATYTISSAELEGETFDHQDGDAYVKTDTLASGGKYLWVTDTTKVERNFTLDGANTMVLRLKADECEGWPEVTVKIDDKEVLKTTITSIDWTDYTTSFQLEAATDEEDGHTLSVEFTNDKYVNGKCDRNLWFDKVTLKNNSTNPIVQNQYQSLLGKTKYVGMNQLLGYVSNSRSSERDGADLSLIPNANQTYLSYRIMWNNPSFTVFPRPSEQDSYINAQVDNMNVVEIPENTVAGSLQDINDQPDSPMWFFCAHRTKGNNVRCIYAPNPI